MEELLRFKDIIKASGGTYIIGVAGDSGSGKSTFTGAIRRIFGDDLVSTITLDDYHLYDRQQRKDLNITPLAPGANNLAALEKDLALIREGIRIKKPVYDHSTGTFGEPVDFHASGILILEGLHTLSTPGLRRFLDFSLYVDPAPDVKREWKIKRDMDKRGYSEREAMEEISRRERDFECHIAPQRKYADSVIEIAFSKYGRNLGWLRNIYRITLIQSPISGLPEEVSIKLDLLPFLTSSDRQFMLEYGTRREGEKSMAALTIDGEFSHSAIDALAEMVGTQTGISGAGESGERPVITASDLVQIILAWIIIRRSIAEE